MPSAVKKTPFLSRLGNERGQAVVEYTLVLIVTIAILLGLMQALFKPFGEFVSNYMGKYTACLLEYGELPSMGSDTPTEPDEDSECNKRFEAVTLANGRPPSSGGSGSTTSSNGKKTTTPTPQTASSSTTAGSASRGGSSNINFNRRPSGGVEGGSRKNAKVIQITLENGGAGSFYRNSRGERWTVNSQKSRAIGLTGLTEAEKKELEKKADGSGNILATGATVNLPKKKLAIKPPPPKEVVEQDKPFTLGNFIRYLFIAALVIALVIFIGGQALQMSKSGEK